MVLWLGFQAGSRRVTAPTSFSPIAMRSLGSQSAIVCSPGNMRIGIPAGRSDRQGFADGRWPPLQVETVCPEQRQGEAVQTKSNAGGVGCVAGVTAQAPGFSEIVAMIIEAHTSCRLLLRVHRNQQFKLQ